MFVFFSSRILSYNSITKLIHNQISNYSTCVFKPFNIFISRIYYILMIPIYAKLHSTDSDYCRLRVDNVYHLWKYLSELCRVRLWDTLHKKWSFPLRISSVNVTKSAGGFVQFGHFLCSDESWRRKEFSFALRIYWVNTA